MGLGVPLRVLARGPCRGGPPARRAEVHAAAMLQIVALVLLFARVVEAHVAGRFQLVVLGFLVVAHLTEVRGATWLQLATLVFLFAHPAEALAVEEIRLPTPLLLVATFQFVILVLLSSPLTESYVTMKRVVTSVLHVVQLIEVHAVSEVPHAVSVLPVKRTGIHTTEAAAKGKFQFVRDDGMIRPFIVLELPRVIAVMH